MDKVDLRAFMFCSTAFPLLTSRWEKLVRLIFPTFPHHIPAPFPCTVPESVLFHFATAAQSRQRRKSGSLAPAWLCFQSQWREKELYRGILLKGMLVWGLWLYTHRQRQALSEQKATNQKDTQRCMGVGKKWARWKEKDHCRTWNWKEVGKDRGDSNVCVS